MTTNSAVPLTLMQARQSGAPPLHRLLLGLAHTAFEKVAHPLTGTWSGEGPGDAVDRSVDQSRGQAWSA